MSKADRPKVNPALKLALELGPLLIFFAANTRPQLFRPLLTPFISAELLDAPHGEVFTATPVFMVATLTALIAGWFLTRHIPIMPLVSAVFVLIFGGLTMLLRDQAFIQMKPTIVNALFGVILLGGLATGRSLLRYVLDMAFTLTDADWKTLTWRWGVFFLFLSVLNEVIWRNFSYPFWTNFKVFGVMPLTFLFTMTQLPLILRSELKNRASGSDEGKS